MEIVTAIIVVVVLLIIGVMLEKLYVIIPPRRFALVERFGRFDRVLLPGVYALWPVIEYLKSVSWTYTDAQGQLRVESCNILSLDNAQMDLPPFECLTEDQIMVTIDGTLMYHISNPQVAVYQTDDVLNMLYQCAQQAIRNCVSVIPVSDLHGKDNTMGQTVQHYVNTKMVDRGVQCDMFIVQNVTIDPKILAANQDIYTRSRQSRMELEAQEARHVQEMAELEHRAKREQAEQRLETAKAAAKADVDRIAARVYKDNGYNVDQILELERIRSMNALANSSNKIIYAPLPFWGSPSVKNLNPE
jgi:regulator of protease activity HflC (stomatin/prohibitin superfamily)